MDRLTDNATDAELASLRKDNERLRAELAAAKRKGPWVLHPWVADPRDIGWTMASFLHGTVAFGSPITLALFFVIDGATPVVQRAAIVTPLLFASWFLAWMRREVTK